MEPFRKALPVARQSNRAYTQVNHRTAGGNPVSITLTPDQQDAIEQAIQAGLVGSVDEFIGSAIGSLSRRESEFDPEKARLAVARIRELRKGVTLDLQGMSLREQAHAGHRY
jgi:Arc/MetJ-type ribon-helix-helix transcriptional regulator